MENQNNNNLSELDQLKAQYETLKERFDQQEIINDRLLKSSIKNSTDYYTRYRRRQFILYPLFAVIGLLCIHLFQGNDLSIMLFWIVFLSVCFAIEIWTMRKLKIKTMENNDLLTLSNKARNFKKLYSLYIAQYPIPVFILTLGILFANTEFSRMPNMGAFIISLGALVALFVGVSIAEFRYKTKHCDDIIRQIEASEIPTDNKIRLNRQQKWFCIAMSIVFLGLDLWAFMIVAEHAKLPPKRPHEEYVLEYERGTDDFTTEGTLEIRPVDADTVAISSELLDGKPMVQYVEVTVPDKKSDTDMVQINVTLTPEASQLWYQFTTKAKGHRVALYLNGIKVQDWDIKCGISNGCFFIMKERSSKEELGAFCEQLIRQ